MPIDPKNNLDFIRTFLALGVLSFHTFQVLGISYPQLPWVASFIAISGFLVTDSMYRSAGYWQFAWKRLLRVGPAFALSLGLVAMLGGSIVGALTDWIGMGFIVAGANLPLWSLSLEEALYVALAVCFALGIYRTQRRAALGLFILFVATAFASTFASTETAYIFVIALTFISGSALCVARERVKWSPVAGVICLAIATYLRNSELLDRPIYVFLIGPLLAYGLITIGCHTRPVFANFKRRIGDPSLGIYVYHFPILMWLYTSEDIKGWWLYQCTLMLTIPVAVVSWHLVEKRTLRMKSVFSSPDIPD